MDSLGRLQQRIVSPVLQSRNPSPERAPVRSWGIRRSRGLNSRHHNAPLSASSSLSRGRSKPLMSTRRGQFSTSGSTAPGSSRATSPQKSFTEYLSDVIIPIPIQMPVDEFNMHKSSGAQSFCSTSRIKYVALPHVSESRASSGTTPRPGSRPVAMCSERYMVTPVTQVSIPKSLRSSHPRPKSEQQSRFEEGSKALARCRVLKRTSEILSHRMDRLYYMAGVSLSMGDRYATDEEALKRMQALAQEARMLQIKNNTPCDSLPKLNQISPDLMQESVNGEAEPVGEKKDEGEKHRDPPGMNLASDENTESFFITQNGVDGHPHQVEEKEVALIKTSNETEINERTEAVDKPDDARPQIDPTNFADDTQNPENGNSTELPDTKSSGDAPDLVRERRFMLFGSENRPERTNPAVTRRSSLRVQSMFHKFKMNESSKDEELEELKSSDESSEEEDDEEMSIEDVNRKMHALLQRKANRKLEYDKSIFNGVKYTSSVHKQEGKREEFRKVTRHLVVKQEESILHIEPNMDEEQAAIFSKIFNDIDTNNRGRIGVEELQANLFSHLKVADLPHFLRVFDLNNDRKIDRREFLAVAGLNDKLCKQRTTSLDGNWNVDLEKLSYYITVYKEMFNAVDIDHDGRLSLEELMVIIAASLDEETGTDIDLMEDILGSIDKDDSGYIDFVEYLQYIPMFLQIHNYLMRRPMLIEDIERSRKIVRTALNNRSESESSGDNIWDE